MLLCRYCLAMRIPQLTRQIHLLADEQIGQMYELMNAIRERELSENDPEFDPTKTK